MNSVLGFRYGFCKPLPPHPLSLRIEYNSQFFFYYTTWKIMFKKTEREAIDEKYFQIPIPFEQKHVRAELKKICT